MMNMKKKLYEEIYEASELPMAGCAVLDVNSSRA